MVIQPASSQQPPEEPLPLEIHLDKTFIANTKHATSGDATELSIEISKDETSDYPDTSWANMLVHPRRVEVVSVKKDRPAKLVSANLLGITKDGNYLIDIPGVEADFQKISPVHLGASEPDLLSPPLVRWRKAISTLNVDLFAGMAGATIGFCGGVVYDMWRSWRQLQLEDYVEPELKTAFGAGAVCAVIAAFVTRASVMIRNHLERRAYQRDFDSIKEQ